MFFRKGHSGGFFKKATDFGHLGFKVLGNPITHTALSVLAPNSTATKVSGYLQKSK